MYLNNVKGGMATSPPSWLTITLDVFKLGESIRLGYKVFRLTITLDVFKCWKCKSSITDF